MSGSIALHAVPGALVEGLVLQLAHVGDESDFVLVIRGGHVVFDVIRIDGFGDGADRDQRQNHGQSQKQSQKLFHGFLFLLQELRPLNQDFPCKYSMSALVFQAMDLIVHDLYAFLYTLFRGRKPLG